MMGDRDKFIFLILLLFGTSFIACTKNNVSCTYKVFENYQITIKNEIQDIGIQDINCNRKVELQNTFNKEKVSFSLHQSNYCDFFIKKIVYKKTNFLIFFSLDNPLINVINLNKMKETPQVEFDNNQIIKCNCNELNCEEQDQCKKILLCDYNI